MIKYCLILFSVIFVSLTAEATKFALVIGGIGSGGQSTDHEFGTPIYLASKGLEAKGYQVTTLFGQKPPSAAQAEATDDGKKKKPTTADSEIEKYKKDYDAIKGLKSYDGPATAETIKKYFADLQSKIKSGDTVEISLKAHGHSSCEGKVAESDSGSAKCEHEIDLSDENGNPVKLKTKDLVAYIKQLEDKGALVNLNVNSCFSGLLQQEIAGLKNACVYLSAAPNSVSYTCMEDDFKTQPPARDFTSVSDAMLFRYYKDSLEQLKQDPYLAQNKCFSNRNLFHSSNSTDYTSFESTYWGSRKTDEALHEPSISSHPGESFLNMGLYSAQFMHHINPICENFTTQLDRLVENAQLVQDTTLNVLVQKLKSSVTSYNESITAQKNLIAELNASQDDAKIAQIRQAQKKTEALSHDVIKNERAVVEHIYQNKLKHNTTNSNCQRPL